MALAQGTLEIVTPGGLSHQAGFEIRDGDALGVELAQGTREAPLRIGELGLQADELLLCVDELGLELGALVLREVLSASRECS
jgi:hypothetical protein